MGPENSSDWLSPCRHRDWGSRWFNSKRLRRHAAGRRQGRESPEAKTGAPRLVAWSDRASGQERPRHRFPRRPGVVIGKKGEDIEQLRTDLQRIVGVPVHVSIEEIRKPEIDAQLIADSIAQQLEKRIMFRRAMKRAMQNAMRLGAQGIKVMSAGRLNGAEIARTEWYREGRVPLHPCAPTSTTATSRR